MSVPVEPQSIRRFHVFLASPGDVEEERQVVREFFEAFNRAASDAWNVEFELLEGRHVSAGHRGTVQDKIIAETLKKREDTLLLFIGLMWQRFGTPTGKHESGTEAEFEWAYKRDIECRSLDIKWFFRKADALVLPTGPSKQLRLQLEQWEKAAEFRDRVSQRSFLFKEYADPRDFAGVFVSDMLTWLLAADRPWIESPLVQQNRVAGSTVQDNLLADEMDLLRPIGLFKETELPWPYVPPRIQYEDVDQLLSPRELFHGHRIKILAKQELFEKCGAPSHIPQVSGG